MSLLFGLVIGLLEIFYLNKLFANQRFLVKIILKSTLYFVFVVIITLIIITLTNAIELNLSPFHPTIRNFVWIFFTNLAFWSILAYFTMAIIFGLFYLEISNNVGEKVLLNFFAGKYHHPVKEERMYMFIDMNQSTTIAEHLGHNAYFSLLKQYYSDLSDAIITYGGEIYQYVGDEMVISWRLKKANKPAHILACFFAMKQILQAKKDWYLSKFGILPSFKAGIHVGEVTTGELGVIKKEIAFSGDVLNTAARIQALCKEKNAELLISEQFLALIDSKKQFSFNFLGEEKLRGRNEKINLYSVHEHSKNALQYD